MVYFQKRRKAIRHLIFLFSLLILTFVIFYPWSQMRRSGAESLDSILRRHVETHSEAVSTTLEQTLSVYETAAQFLFGLIQTYGDEWIEGNYSSFLKTCTTIRESIDLKPHAFFMHVNKSYVMLQYAASNVSVETGPADSFRQRDLFIPNRTMWRNSVVDGAAYMMVFVGDEELGAAIFVELSVVADLVVPIANAVEGRMALIDRNSGVMIEDRIGAVDMIGVTEFNEPVYPTLSELESPFWSVVNGWWTQSGPDKVRHFQIDNVEYLFFETVISPSVSDAYCLVTVFPLSDTVENVFYVTSLVLVCTIVLLYVIALSILWLTRRIEGHRQRKLVMEPFASDCNVHGHRAFIGALGRSMERLRLLQLRFPDDETLNRVLDSVVSNLSRPKDMLWAVEAASSGACSGLCRFLVHEEIESANGVAVKRAFSAWADMRMEAIETYPELGTLAFPIRRHLQDPIQQLLTLMVTILVKEGLLFSQFDIDGLLMFMKKTATLYCKDNIHTAHLLFTLHYFLNKPFKNWITNKLDLFILYFAAFVYDTDFTAVFNFDEDDEFSESTEEVWHDHSGENSSDSDSESRAAVDHLRLHISAFTDDESILSRNVRLTLELFHEFIRKNPDDPVSSFFENTVTDILYSIDSRKQFALLGEFSVRIESSDFSVSNKLHDRLLFMKALLKLCDFCQCYTLVDGSAEEQERWVQRILLQDDQSAAPSFHYDHARLIVAPWLEQFAKFDPLTEVVGNFNHYLAHWKLQK